MAETQNYFLQSWLQSEIRKLPMEQRIILKNLEKCSRNVLPHNVAIQDQPAVFLLSNGEHSKFFGHLTCKNTWACPVCTARIMEKRRQRIAAALDALGDKLFAFSLTFTIPHLRFQSCHEVTDILYKTWQRFNSAKSCSQSREDQFTSPIKNFFKLIKHYVRVGEYTWGKNGWHPHFHFIFWTDFESAKTIAQCQTALQKSWNKMFENIAKAYWKKNNLDRDINKFLNCIEHAALNKTSESVYFSLNKDGSLFRVQSSDYISGWGGDSEATGNRLKKASHNDHLTQWQILELAPTDKKYAELYIEFCLETSSHVHQRTAYSKSLKSIIDKHIQTQGYKSVLKKKSDAEWKVLLWFTKQQWLQLCDKNLHYPILSNILFLAQNSENLDTLLDYLVSEIGEVYLPASHKLSKFVESMFNDNKKAA